MKLGVDATLGKASAKSQNGLPRTIPGAARVPMMILRSFEYLQHLPGRARGTVARLVAASGAG
jgi:hypothetical protein